MRDIEINTPFLKFHYLVTWIGFIVCGFIIAWLIAVFLYTYGQYTVDNKAKKKGVLGLTYQKFIFVYGSIFGYLVLLGLLLDILRIFI